MEVCIMESLALKLLAKCLFALACMSGSSLFGIDTTVSASLKKETLLNHIFLMQELKQCAKNKQTKVLTEPKAGKLTPTQAYLSIPTLKQGIENKWPNEIKQHKPMIDTIMAREQELNDTHYVFYHGQNGSFRIFQDFLKEWYRLMHMKEELNEFDMLRLWEKAAPQADANGFLDKYNGNIDNYRPEIQEVILSVNLSLFANLYDCSACTFRYFTDNYSMRPPNIRTLVQQVFTEHGIDHKHIDALFKLAVEENKANLLQIFIPKELVDQCTYLAIRGGKPNRNSIVGSCFDKTRGWHTKISPILDLYQSNPSALTPQELDLLQGRIVLSQDIMLNPDSGVKIFRYTPIDDTKVKSYQKEVETFAKKVFVEYLQKKINFTRKTNLDVFLRQLSMICNLPQTFMSAQPLTISNADKKTISKDLEKIGALMHKETDYAPTTPVMGLTEAPSPKATSLLSNIISKLGF